MMLKAPATIQRGGVREAIEQLEMLEKDFELDYYERARVTARLMELRIHMVEMHGEERRS